MCNYFVCLSEYAHTQINTHTAFHAVLLKQIFRPPATASHLLVRIQIDITEPDYLCF